MSSILSDTRKELIEENEEEAKRGIEKALEKWHEANETLVIYIEHADIEKTEMYITEAKSYIETKEYTMAVQSVDTSIFLLEHFKDKYKFTLKNIF